MSLFSVNPATRLALARAIDDGTAVKVEAANFRNIDAFGEVAQEIEFYWFEDKLFRSEYECRTTITTYQEVTKSEDYETFIAYYGDSRIVAMSHCVALCNREDACASETRRAK